MTEDGEGHKTDTYASVRSYLEAAENSPAAGSQTLAGLGFEGFALEEPDPEQAAAYLERAQTTFRTILRAEGRISPYPTQPEIFAKAHLNLAPVIYNLVVLKQLSDPAVVKESYAPFIRDLGKQARAAQKLVRGPKPNDAVMAMQQAALISTFNEMSTVGLLLRFQTDVMQTSDWMALPAFLQPGFIKPGASNPLAGHWHANIFSGPSSKDFELQYKVYVRTGSTSPHERMADPETSVIWLAQDLALPGEDSFALELDIIKDLDSKTKRAQERSDARTDKLLEKIDARTAGSLPDPEILKLLMQSRKRDRGRRA